MTELSPTSQAVLDAFKEVVELTWLTKDPEQVGLAAALRVISEFVRMDQPLGDTDADAGVLAAHQWIHGYIAAMADELEAQA